MTDNEKMIQTINGKLARMTTVQLRIMFIIATKMADANTQEQEAEEAAN